MADSADYQQKLDSLQKYIPFLVNMISELKAKGNREPQLKKIQLLYDMITDTKKKLKIKTLDRCEVALANIYFKVNPQLRPKVADAPSDLPSIGSPISTPQSPSPPRDIILTKPVTIPTEKVVTSLPAFKPGSPKSNRPKIDVYSNVVINSPSKPKSPVIPARIPDMSKPPISLEDLRTLEDDVQDQITIASFANKSVDELQEVKKQLQLQLKVEEVSLAMESKKPHDELAKVQISSQSNTSKGSKNPSSPIKEIKSPTYDRSTKKDKGNALHFNKTCSLKESDMFGNLLSSIDDKIMEEKKKSKKSDRRPSLSGSASNKDFEKGHKEKKNRKHDKSKEDSKHKSKIDKDSSKLEHKSKGHKIEERKNDRTYKDDKEKLKDDSVKTQDNSNFSKDVHAETTPKPVNAFKRLADKYNPKPKQKNTNVDDAPDVDNSVSIEQMIKTPASRTLAKPLLEANADQQKPVQLPEILQKMFNKPLLGNIPKNLNDTTPSKSSECTKSLTIQPPEPLHIIPPHHNKPLHFQPPTPCGQGVLPTPDIVVNSPVPSHGPLPNPGFSRGLLPTPQILPPTFNEGLNLGFSTPRADFDSPGTPRLDFEQPRQDFCESQNFARNDHYNMNQMFVPHIQEHQMHGYVGNFMGQRHFPHQPEMNSSNMYFGPNQMPVHPTQGMQRFVPDQPFYQDRTHWVRDRRPSDPRNYKEYKEMRERQERAAQERQKDIKDPRLEPRPSRENVGEKVKVKDSRDAEVQDIKDKELGGDLHFGKAKEKGKNFKDEKSSKFDKMYSTNKARSSSRTVEDKEEEEDEAFTSPLDSLYNIGEKSKTGRGYGVQSFKIPKKFKINDEKQTLEKREEEKQSSGRRRNKVRELSDSEESDTNVRNDNDDAEDSDAESVEDNLEIDEKVESVNDPQEDEGVEPKVDTSRIKAVIGSKEDIWKTDSDACDENEFISEYEKQSNAVSRITRRSSSKSESEDTLKVTHKNVDNSLESDDLKTPSDSAEPAEESKGTNKDTADQKSLSLFFENLFKSINKKEKKTALFSLIETFSDTFDDKAIQKIRKIIKVDEEEDNDEGDGEKQDGSGTSTNESTPGLNKSEEIEEQPVVGSTTEEDQPLLQSSSSAEENRPGETQVNEITKSVDDSAEQTDEKTKSEDSDVASSLAPVMVSVGERIKNRRRNPVQKKKHKSELDHLHEDIQDMFIRDGVLTATGKRMCRILKDDPNALTNTSKPDKNQSSSSPDSPKKIRKKPGPKPKPKNSQEATSNSLKDMRVLIKKIPDEMLNSNKIPSGRKLRSHNRNSYAEVEEDTSVDDISLADRDSLLTASDKSDLEDELTGESEGEEKKEDLQKPRVKRRKTAKWASGIIPKLKKKKSLGKSKENTPERVSTPVASSPNKFAVFDQVDMDTLVEPDKDYYYDYTVKKKIRCKLCKYTGHLLPGHYLREHPQSEVLCSRFPPSIGAEAISDFAANGKTFESITKFKSSGKYHYSCRMCGYKSFVTPIFFYEHVTTHTGEYRHQCGICEYVAVTGKTMASHFMTVHPEEEKKIIKTGYNNAVIFGYMCAECNFVQLKKKSVEDHANIFHLGDKPVIYKINMSTTLDPQLLPQVLPSDQEDDSVADDTPEVPKRRKPGPKPKNLKEKTTDDDQAKENPAPKLRKRPGPKSKTLPVETEIPESSEDTPTAPPVRRKPGPKSKTQKSNLEELKSLKSRNETSPSPALDAPLPTSVADPFESTPTRKRRRSLEKLIAEDSCEDLDSIITFSSRSSRAAKEAATAKLKTLMEANEGTSPRKKTDSESIKDSNKQADAVEAEKENPDGIVEDADTATKEPREMSPPKVNDAINKDLNVFTCKNDILQEDAKKIELDRLNKMNELNKSITSRTLNIDFIHKLSHRLNNEQKAEETLQIKVKEEPHDEDPLTDTSTMPCLERQASEISKSPPPPPVVNKKLCFDEDLGQQPNISFRQDKPNSLFSNMIEKLQGKVNEAAEQGNEEENNDTQAPSAGSTFISIGDLIRATRIDKEITYSCHVNRCYVATKDKIVFQLHCKFGHKDLNVKSSLCEKCGVMIDVTQDTTLLENLYDHLVFAHSDFINPSLNATLRMRKLSGDKLSVKEEKDDSNPQEPMTAEISTDFENGTQQHLIDSSPDVGSASVDTAEAPENDADENPFQFKIESVVSLAESNDNDNESPTKPKPQPPALPPLKHIPPLSLIGNNSKQTNHQAFIVKEAKLTPAEIARPKKAPKALQKFVTCPGALYKCPHFYCMFSTNIRTMFTCHLKVHKCNVAAMIRCVYCDLKTPWEHVPMHIDIRHAACRFSCSHCLYRAVLKEYVCLHQEQAHPDKESIIYSFPPHKAAKKFSASDSKVDLKTVCKPFRCSCSSDGNQLMYLFETEFANHLSTAHNSTFLHCGYQECKSIVEASMMLNHWHTIHQVNTYQCGYCSVSCKETFKMYAHFAQAHPSLMPDILVRKNDYLPQDRELRFTEEAFNHVGHIKKAPGTLFATIEKRMQRACQIIACDPVNEASEGARVETPPTSGTPLLIKPLSPVQNPPLQAPNIKLIVASTGGGNIDKLYLVPANIVPSPPKGQIITSTAGINKVVAQTSASTASQSVLKPIEPVRIGGVTLYPADDSGVVQNTMLAQSLFVTSLSSASTPSERPLFTFAGITEPQVSSTGSNVQDDLAGSENDSTAVSEDDLLQSAIQSILDDNDSSSSNAVLEPPSSKSNLRDSVLTPPPLLLLTNAASTSKTNNQEQIAPVEQVIVPGNEADFLNDESNSEVPLGDDNSTDPLSGDPLVTSTDPLQVETALEKRVISVASTSDEESEGAGLEKKKHGLTGYQLFRCNACNLSFSNVKTFKTHLITSVACKKAGDKDFVCVHCKKWFVTARRLADHILTHGIPRFSCSLCNEKFSVVMSAKIHMKNRHSIQQTNLVPLVSDKNNAENDMFVIKPCQTNPPNSKEKESDADNAKSVQEEQSYTPKEIESIPIRQIFSTNVKCGLCNYQTKVRVNIIRHLQMHLEEKAVPDTAPVNPVPCLEKNEKMFDKMINLAASSISTGRMGGPSKAVKEKEEDNYPEFVPSHRRYVCCAQGCSYLCPEEANLKHHLMALHSDEVDFTCAHCKVKIEPADIESVIKHFKLHGLHLYKCHYCSFLHHLKHKVEKHVSDGHLDSSMKVVTVRCMESEPIDRTVQDETHSSQPLPRFKPWSCCMCKAKYHTKDEIQSHITKKHNIDSQYKCTLCAFKNDEKHSLREHFKDQHPDHDFDIIFVYQKVEEEVPKDDVNSSFDTTPLWQRDKPRVRHIRGILFDEVAPQPCKSPKKHKTYGSVGQKVVVPPAPKSGPVLKTPPQVPSGSKATPDEKNSASKNLFDIINAVARGDFDVSNRPGSSGMVTMKKEGAKEKNTPKSEAPVLKDETDDSTNDDVVIVPSQVPSVIVIDSDESDSGEAKASSSKDDDVPKTKDKDSKTNPMAKNRALKRKNSNVLQEAVKMARIEDPDDHDYNMSVICNPQSLTDMFGSFGTPHNKQWKCPKCNQFKSKRVGDFIFHLFKDFNTYRYRCSLCSDVSITFKYMQDHLKLHPASSEDVILSLPSNIKLETWIQMVLREQSLIILKDAPLFKKRPLTGPTDITCYFCNEKFVSMPECYEHMLYHWVMMPYQCQHCSHEFYTVYDLKHHHKIEHPDAKLYLEPKGPTLAKAMQCVETTKRPSKSTTQGPPKKKPRLVEDVEKKSKEAHIIPSKNNDDIVNIEDDEDDLLVVSKVYKVTSNEDEVFACDLCASLAETKELIKKHLDQTHGVKSNKFHSIIKSKSNLKSTLKLACNVCNEVFTELLLRRHFLNNHSHHPTFAPYRFACELCQSRFLTFGKLKNHFNKAHVGKSLAFKCMIPQESGIKNYNYKEYSCSLCAYTVISATSLAIIGHVKGHLKSILCNRCNGKFKYVNEVLTHNKKQHGSLPLDYVVLKDVADMYETTIASILTNAVAISTGQSSMGSMLYNKAKKSTSAPFVSSTALQEEGYSFYGKPQEKFDLSRISTTFEMGDLEYSTTAEQMMKMFNMNTYVDVSGCNVDLRSTEES